MGIAFFYILIFHLSSLILISYKFKNIRGQAFYHFFIKRLTISTKLVNYNRLRDNPLAYHYIIINIALATPIPRYAMRPVISNANFFIFITSFTRSIDCIWNIYTNFRKNFSNLLDYW